MGRIGESIRVPIMLVISMMRLAHNEFHHDDCCSFNLLVPTGGCATNDQYAEYVAARGLAHVLPLANLTTFSASSSNQDWSVTSLISFCSAILYSVYMYSPLPLFCFLKGAEW